MTTLDKIRNAVVGFIQEWFKHIIFLGACSLLGWVGILISNSIDKATEKYTSLPKKFESIILIHTQDSLKARKHEIADSLKDVCTSKQFDYLKHRMDSLSTATEVRVSNMERYVSYDYQYTEIFKGKLHIK